MKTKTLLILFTVFNANAQDHHEVNLFDERIVVEVKTETATSFDETPLWKTLENDGWKAAKQAIQGNQVSAALTEEIDYQKSVETLKKAMKKKRYSDAEALLAANESWVNCDRIEWVWLDLQQEVVSGYGENAQTKYQYVLDNCEGHEQSTAIKLFGWAGANAGDDIVARYRKSPGFDVKVAEKMEHDIMLSTLSHSALTERELVRLSSNIKARRDGQAAETLGWKYLKLNDADSALNWFENAIRWSGPTQNRVEGKLQSLQHLGELESLHQEHQTWLEKYPKLAELEFGSETDGQIQC
ncbi:hypothetical protein AT251_23470, partial [Enterovibrio nigricans]